MKSMLFLVLCLLATTSWAHSNEHEARMGDSANDVEKELGDLSDDVAAEEGMMISKKFENERNTDDDETYDEEDQGETEETALRRYLEEKNADSEDELKRSNENRDGSELGMSKRACRKKGEKCGWFKGRCCSTLFCRGFPFWRRCKPCRKAGEKCGALRPPCCPGTLCKGFLKRRCRTCRTKGQTCGGSKRPCCPGLKCRRKFWGKRKCRY